MGKPTKLGVIAAALMATALGISACGGESQASAEQQMCQALGNYASAMTGLQGMGPQSSVEAVRTQVDTIQSAWQGVADAAQDLASADTSAVESAQSDLQSAVSGLSDDITLEQAAQQLQPQVQALAQTYQETYNGLNCSAQLTSATSS